MEQVGYQLIEISTDKVIQSWGGIWGQCPGIPNPVLLPSGEQLCAPEINVDYYGYILKPWMMDGPPVPQQVAMWAVRTILQNDNLFDQAQATITASTDNALKNAWEYGNFANRNSKAINTIANELGLTDAQIDQMFIDANNLVV